MLSPILLLVDHYFRRFDHRRALLARRIRRAERSLSRLPERDEPISPLPEIDASQVDLVSFRRLTNDYRTPLVVRRFVQESEAVRNWSLPFFAEVCGGQRYPVVLEHPDGTKQMQLVSLSEVVESVNTSGPRYYINNLTRIFADHPELIEDLQLDRLLPLVGSSEADQAFSLVNLFMGGAGTGTPMHAAFAGNFFVNVVGRKKWTLVDPRWTYHIVPVPSIPCIFADAVLDPCNEETARLSQRLPRFETTLGPGDILYNAPWWWHSVQNIDPFTVGCAVRNQRFLTDLSNSVVLTMMSQSLRISVFSRAYRLRNLVLGRKGSFRALLQRHLDTKIYDARDSKNHKFSDNEPSGELQDSCPKPPHCRQL